MRAISGTITVPVDGKPVDFRLTKPDAFSGVFLLRLLAKLPEGSGAVRHPERPCHPERSEGSSPFSFLPDAAGTER